MTHPLSSVVADFVRHWEEMAKDPAARRTEDTAVNIICALAEELSEEHSRAQTSRSGKSLGKLATALATQLRLRLQRGDYEIAMLDSMVPGSMSALRMELSRLSVDQVGLGSVIAPIVELANHPMEALVGHLLFLARNLSPDAAGYWEERRGRLIELTRLGVRGLLFVARADETLGNVKRAMSAGLVREVIAACRRAIGEDENVHLSLVARREELLTALRSLNWVDRKSVLDEWQDGYRELARYIEHLNAAREDPDAAFRELVLDIAKSRVALLVHMNCMRFLNDVPEITRRVWDAVDHVAAVVGDWLQRTGYVRHRSGYWYWGGVLAASCRTEIANEIASLVAPNIVRAATPACEELRARFEVHAKATQSLDDRERLWYVADRSVQEGLLIFDRAIRDLVAPSIAAALDELRFDRGHGAQLTNAILTYAVENAIGSDSAWSDTHLERLDPQQLDRALVDLGSLHQGQREFDVVIPLRGIELANAAWISAPLMWYTSDLRSLGDRDLRPAGDGATSSLHVWQRVSAESPFAANERAREILEPALSALSFALSFSTTAGGIRPEFDIVFWYGDVLKGMGGSRGHRGREEMSNKRPGAEFLEKFSRVYSPLVERASDLSRINSLESGLLRALYWYRSGRWQPVATRRFLDHFVALEHLFVRGQSGKDQVLADRVSKLYGSWQFRPQQFTHPLSFTLDAARTLADAVRNHADLTSALRGRLGDRTNSADITSNWEQYLHPWLDPDFVSSVTAMVPVDLAHLPWQRHLAALQQLRAEEPDWVHADKDRRDTAWFKIRVLAKRRHAIVHDGLTHVRGIEYEAQALTKVLEDVLQLLVGAVLSEPPLASSIEGLLDSLSPPWSS